MKRIICCTGSGAVVLALAWIGGFDFDTRGFTAIFISIYFLLAVVGVYFYPGWKEPK